MTDAELIALADANCFATMRTVATLSERGEAREKGGVLAVATGLPLAMLNIAFVTRALADPMRQIGEAAAFFDERKLPFVVRIREGLDAATERACEALGLPYSDTLPGMVLADVAAATKRADGLEIRAVTRAEYEDHVETIAAGFHMPIEAARGFLPPEAIEGLGFSAYNGYVDGKPVATSALFLSDRVAGVYNVATLAEYRGRGIGEAMTCHAVREGAARGAVMGSLQASEMGRPVYERIGFRVVAPYRTFHRPGV